MFYLKYDRHSNEPTIFFGNFAFELRLMHALYKLLTFILHKYVEVRLS